MMTDNELDKLLSDKLLGYQEAAPDVWGGISSGLDSRRRWRVVRRVSYAAVAAAACLLAGLFLFDSSSEVSSPSVEAPVRIAAVSEPVAVEPIAQQIRKFAGAGVVAKAEPVREPVTEPVTEPVAETVAVAASAEEVAEEPVSEQPAAQPSVSDISAVPDENFWYEDRRSSQAHTSQISILTNLSSVSSTGAEAASGPRFAGGSDGSAAVSIESVGEIHYNLPLSFGVQYKAHLGGDFYLSAGVNYTFLSSRFDALVNKESFQNVRSQQHYIGIPLTFSYNFVESGNWNFYANAGGAVEKGLRQKYFYGDKVISDSIDGFQFSAMAGLGVEYWITPFWGIYLDPSLAYYFKGSQPVSIRTQQPLQFRFELGFRFGLQ